MRMPTSSPLVFCLALLVGQAAGAAAQSIDWAKQAGGPCAFPCGIGFHQASAIAVDGAGNSVVTGHITGSVVFGRGELNETTLVSEGNSLFIAKFDIHGALLWARAVGGDLRGLSIAVDAAGNSYVAGNFRFGAGFPDTPLIGPASGVGDFFIAKYDAAGDFVWARQGGPDFVPGLPGAGSIAWRIAVDSAGNSRLTGGFGTPTGMTGFFVARYDAGGSRVWVSTAMEDEANPGAAAGTGVALDAAGNSYVVGDLVGSITFGLGEPRQTTLVGNSLFVHDFFVAKYGDDGRLVWAKQVGGTGFDQGLGIAADAAGHVHVTGTFDGTVTFGAGDPTETVLTANFGDMFVARYNTDGSLEWARHAPGLGFGGGAAIAVDASGGSHVTGGFVASVTFGPGEANETVLSVDPGGSTNVFVAKYDSGGDLLWARAATGTFAAVGRAVAADTGGNTYITGDFAFVAPFGGLSSLTFGLGEPNQTTLTTEFAGEIFVARYMNDDGEPINRRPIADAGVDQTVAVGATVMLDGTGSSDPDLDQLTYQWTLSVKPANSDAVLQSAATANPTFVADVSGTYQVDLVVSDGQASSAPDTVVVRTENRRPTANAGADQSATTGSTIQLNGAGSSDPDGDPLAFAWSFVATPPQSAAALNSPTSLASSFIADVPGVYVVQLIVSDGQLESVADTVTITVTPPESSVLGCGSLVSGTIAAAGEVDLYSFTGQTGQIISLALASTGGFASRPGSGSVVMRLIAPSGAVVGVLASNSQNVYTLPADGVYSVRVNANNLRTTGSYNISRECLFPVQSPDVVPMPCGGLAAGTIGVPGETDLFMFAGEAGQIMSLAIASTAGFASRPSSGSVVLTLFTPAGAVVGTLASNSQNLVTLPVTGVYSIRVSANNLATTGQYTISRECLFPVPSPDAVPLPCGGMVAGAITAPGDTDLMTFTGQAGQIISLAIASTGGFASRPSSGSVVLTLFTAAGAAVGTLASNSQNLFTLPIDGVYSIRVSANNLATTGSYNISRECLFPVQSPDAVPLACGELAPGTIGVPGETALFTFTGQAGQTTTLAIASTGGFATRPSSGSVVLTLFTPAGAVVGTLASNSQNRFTLPVDGIYSIRVSANNLGTTGSYTVRRTCP